MKTTVEELASLAAKYVKSGICPNYGLAIYMACQAHNVNFYKFKGEISKELYRRRRVVTEKRKFYKQLEDKQLSLKGV